MNTLTREATLLQLSFDFFVYSKWKAFVPFLVDASLMEVVSLKMAGCIPLHIQTTLLILT